MTNAYIYRGVRYWTSQPEGDEHIGWNTYFARYKIIHKTAKTITACLYDESMWTEVRPVIAAAIFAQN